jgi:glycosyltransferase involved in cell wall biosynthesis
MLLSILIVSLEKRKEERNRLIRSLNPQLGNRAEILVEIDNGETSVGEKRNRLLQRAAGDYVCFVDDDDGVSSDYVDRIVKAARTLPDCIGFTVLRTSKGENPERIISCLKYKNWQATPDGVPTRPIGHLNPVKRTIASKIRYPDLYYGEDRYYEKELQQYLKTEVIIEDPPMYFYNYDRDKSESVKSDIKQDSIGLKLINTGLPPVPEKKPPTNVTFITMPTITATISTRNRYETTLPLAMMAIINQTLSPNEFILFDDNDKPADLREVEVYRYLFSLFDTKNIKWKVIFGKREGQVKNHQAALEVAAGDWIWRLDDDNVPESNVLQTLVSNIDEKLGAVAGLVITPPVTSLPPGVDNKIQNIYSQDNIQWHSWNGKKEVDHLYSSFLYRKEAGKHGYCDELSRIGHREETIFTYEMKRKGWKLIVDSRAITWHLRAQGGIRSESDGRLWEHDEQIFRRKMEEWKVETIGVKLIHLNNGLGDHLMFLNLLPQIVDKYKDKKLVIACCYPDVFKDCGIQLVSIADGEKIATAMNIDLGTLDVYKFCTDRQWKGHLIEAFAEIYGVKYENPNRSVG